MSRAPQEEDKIVSTTPTSGEDFGKDALKQKKEIVDTTYARLNKVIKNMFIITVPWIVEEETTRRGLLRGRPRRQKEQHPYDGARPKRGSCG